MYNCMKDARYRESWLGRNKEKELLKFTQLVTFPGLVITEYQESYSNS